MLTRTSWELIIKYATPESIARLTQTHPSFYTYIMSNASLWKKLMIEHFDYLVPPEEKQKEIEEDKEIEIDWQHHFISAYTSQYRSLTKHNKMTIGKNPTPRETFSLIKGGFYAINRDQFDLLSISPSSDNRDARQWTPLDWLYYQNEQTSLNHIYGKAKQQFIAQQDSLFDPKGADVCKLSLLTWAIATHQPFSVITQFQSKKIRLTNNTLICDISHPDSIRTDDPLNSLASVSHLGVVDYQLIEIDNPETTLLSAANRNQFVNVQQILQKTGYLNTTVINNALNIAIQNGHTQTASQLFDAADDPSSLVIDKSLIRAAKNGHAETLRRFLDIELTNRHYYNFCKIFITAAGDGNINLVSVILDNTRRFIDEAQGDKRTALYAACRNGHLKMVRYLHAKGARLFENFQHLSPLHAACEGNHTDIVAFLIEGYQIGDRLDRKGKAYPASQQYNRWDDRGPESLNIYQSLRHAIENGNMEIVNLLYFKINQPLSKTLEMQLSILDGCEKTAQICLRKPGIDDYAILPTSTCCYKNESLTFLSLAIKLERIEIIKLLVEKLKDYEKYYYFDKLDYSIYYQQAIDNQQRIIIPLLLLANRDINHQTKINLVCFIIQHQDIELLKIYSEHFPIFLRDDKHPSPIKLALKYCPNNTDMLNFLRKELIVNLTKRLTKFIENEQFLDRKSRYNSRSLNQSTIFSRHLVYMPSPEEQANALLNAIHSDFSLDSLIILDNYRSAMRKNNLNEIYNVLSEAFDLSVKPNLRDHKILSKSQLG